MPADEPAAASAPSRARPATPPSRRRIQWSVNPKETTGSDLSWFIAMAVAFALITAGVALTAYFAQG